MTNYTKTQWDREVGFGSLPVTYNNEGTFIILGNYCFWCDKAKKLMDRYEIEYTAIDYKEEEAQKLKEEMGFKTIPQVWIKGKYIGGYQELSDHLWDEDHAQVLVMEDILGD